jgi:hypothetical protein
MQQTALFLATLSFIFGIGQNSWADKGRESVAGVVVFSANVSLEKAAEIGKKLSQGDANFVHVTAFIWTETEGSPRAGALMFNYAKKNNQFVEGEKLGEFMKKKIEAQFGDIVRSWHIAEGVIALK